MVIYLVQIEAKNGFETEKVKDGYRQCGYLPLPPTSPLATYLPTFDYCCDVFVIGLLRRICDVLDLCS